MFPEDAEAWVLAYKDRGPYGPAPGGGWPTKVAMLFDTEEAARDWWEENKGLRGRHAEVDIYPVQDTRPQVITQPGGECEVTDIQWSFTV